MIAGTLEVQMMADLARLKSDMDQAKSVVTSAAGAMGKALGAIGVGISVAGIAAWIKAGIDAADAAHQISQKTGLAAKDVAGLQLAFKTGVGSADGMSAALAKMAKQAVEGNAAFKSLGVETRNADGTLKSTKQILYDTADAFAGIKDGAGKTALAMEVFGKSGADLIPMLNGGADGLREMAAMAEKLGLVIDDETAAAADQFNDTLDLLGSSTKGMATQIAAQLLPTLNDLAGGFLQSVTEGDRLRTISNVVAAGLKGLYTVIAGGVQIVSTLGQGFGALGASIAALLSGRFSEARSVISDFVSTAKTDWTATIQNIGSVWDGTAGKTVGAASAMNKALREVTVSTKDQEAASKAAAAEARKQAEEMLKLAAAGAAYLAALEDQNDAMEAAVDAGRELTIAEKDLLKLEKDLAESKIILTDAELDQALAEIQRKQALHDLSEQLKATGAENAKYLESLTGQTDTLRQQVEREREAAAAVGMTARELAAREAATLRATAADRDRLAVVMEDVDWSGRTSAQLREQAALLRERADMAEQGVVVKEARDAATAWERVSDQIGQGLTDSLFRAFESGRGFFSTLWQGIKNTFKTTVLKLGIDAVMNPVKSLIGAAMGGAPMAASAGQMFGGDNWLSSGLNFLSSGSSSLMNTAAGWLGLGTSAGMGIGTSVVGGTVMTPAAIEAMIGTAGYGASAAGAAAAAGTGTAAVGAGGGFLSTLGSVAPYLAAAALIASAFQHKPTHHEGSVVYADASGARTDATRDFLGVLQHQNSGTDSALRTMLGGAAGTLNTLSAAFGGTGGFGLHGQFAADNDDASFGILDILRNGARIGGIDKPIGGNRKDYASDPTQGFAEFGADVGRAVRSAIDTIDLPQWASDMLAELGASPGLDQLTAVANEIAATRRGLTDLGSALEPMGGVFTRLAGLSDEAKIKLAGMVGGIEALVAKSRSFVEAYYTQEEQLAIGARNILEQVQKAGVTPEIFSAVTGLGSRDQFRALFEGVDPGTEFGLKMAGLGLNIAQPFAGIGDYLKEQGLTLGELAAKAIEPAVLRMLREAETAAGTGDTAAAETDSAATTAEAATSTATSSAATAAAVAESALILREIADGIAADTTANADGLARVISKLESLDARVAAIETVVTLAAVAPAEA